MTSKRIVSFFLAAIFLLTACSNHTAGQTTYSIPEWFSERAVSSDTFSASTSVDINFYYDNTTGMYPFVCNKDGQSSVGGKAVVTGPLLGWMNALRDIRRQYPGKTYTLQPDNDSLLRWAEFQGEVRNYFGNYEFYTHKGKLPRDGDAVLGPLSQLYYQDNPEIFDPKTLNIVLTDLAEQSVNNKELASHIYQDILLSQEGYAAALIAAQCPFNGKALVPDPLKFSDLVGRTMEGERPLYMILTGPEKLLREVYDNFTNVLAEYWEEGKQYYSTIQSSDEIPTVVHPGDIVVPPTLGTDTLGDLSRKKGKLLEKSIFYDNVALEELDRNGIASLFNARDFLEEEVHAFSYSKNDYSGIILHYYIPVPDYTPNYEWYVATDNKSPSGEALDPTVQKNRVSLLYDYVTFPEDESEEGKSKRKKEESVPVWCSTTGQQTTLLDFESSFTLETELLSKKDIIDEIQSGAVLKNEKGEPYDKYELPEENYIDLNASNYWIHLCIKGKKDTFDGPAVAFALPVYASIQRSSTLPMWVQDMNTTSVNANSTDLFDHTFNLTGFYSTLFGVGKEGEQSGRQAEREVKIADIITVISNLSVK